MQDIHLLDIDDDESYETSWQMINLVEFGGLYVSQASCVLEA